MAGFRISAIPKDIVGKRRLSEALLQEMHRQARILAKKHCSFNIFI
jgi:hypothetical protein